ncbi:hypothetical protein ACJQWY_02285 [Weissella kandleri]|uniref:hypothetical protein n=1 Tax=Weissella kandleri TaxID=1616 RepID=UPI00387E598E
MTMTKEALEFLNNQSVQAAEKAIIHDGDNTFLLENGQVRRFEPNGAPATIDMHTLTGLVTAIKTDALSAQVVSLQVVSPTEVRVFGFVDEYGNRPILAESNALIPDFPFERFIKQEDFQIKMRSMFIQNNHRDILIKFAGDLVDNNEQAYSDDGITQKAIVKSGVASKTNAEVPSPAELQPYRTFMEVAQPESEFIYRINNSNGDMKMALFEADGGAWKLQAMKNIHDYLVEKLPDMVVIA